MMQTVGAYIPLCHLGFHLGRGLEIVIENMHAAYIKQRALIKQEFIENCVFVLTCLNFSQPQSTLHFMQHT